MGSIDLNITNFTTIIEYTTISCVQMSYCLRQYCIARMGRTQTPTMVQCIIFIILLVAVARLSSKNRSSPEPVIFYFISFDWLKYCFASLKINNLVFEPQSRSKRLARTKVIKHFYFLLSVKWPALTINIQPSSAATKCTLKTKLYCCFYLFFRKVDRGNNQ